MKYRKFKNELQVSQLGLGCMRFPVLEDNNAKIDEEQAEKMILHCYENGVNYYDTAYPYHVGTSEKFVGKVLKKHNLRDKIYLATKCPVWQVTEPKGFYDVFAEQLQNLQTDYLDFYLMHSLNAGSWHASKKNDISTFMDTIKKEGRARQIGFSFHDNLKIFKEIVDAYDWDFCQIQLNYMDQDYQAGVEGLQYASKKGLPVVIMEPLKGGRLAPVLTPSMQELFDKNNVTITPVELALKYLFNMPEVSCVLSGASSYDQIVQNVQTASVYGVGDLTQDEKNLIADMVEFYTSRTKVPCTGCLYCIDDCPQRIPINIIFSLYNGRYIYENGKLARIQYDAHVPVKRRPDHCIECGQCEAHCPQHIKIIDELKVAHEDLLSIEM